MKPRMFGNNNVISIDCVPVHVYKMYKDKRPPSMLEPDTSFYLSVNYFKTETHASVEGKKIVQSITSGSEQVKQCDKTGKTNLSGRKNFSAKTAGHWSSSQPDNSNNGA